MDESGHSVLTVQSVMQLDALRDVPVTVAAGAQRLGNPVEWVHVFETPEVAGVLRGGEFLLTTGIGVAGLSAGELDNLIAAVARAGAAGIGFEPAHAPAELLAGPCARYGLPLLVFGRPVRFVDVTHEVHERLVSRELATLRRAVALQSQLREAARQGVGPAGLVSPRWATSWKRRCCWSGSTGRRSRARPKAAWTCRSWIRSTAAASGCRRAWRRGRSSRVRGSTCSPAAATSSTGWRSTRPRSCSRSRWRLSPRASDVAVADRARLLQRLAEGRAGSASDVVRRARSVGVDLSRATLWAMHGRGTLVRLERSSHDVLVDGQRALIAVRGSTDPAAIARELVRLGAVTAVGLDARGGEPWQIREALAGAERASLVAEAAGPPVRHASDLGALAAVAGEILAGTRVESRFDDAGLRTVEALVASGWSKAPAARRLGIARQRLYERLASLSARHDVDFDLPQTRIELALEVWAARMTEIAATPRGSA